MNEIRVGKIGSAPLFPLAYRNKEAIMDFPTKVQVAANFCTIIGVVFAVVVLIFTWMQVKQGTDQARQNTDQARQNVEIARGQFWLELERMFATHDPVHINLRPGGDWWVDPDAPDADETKQPKSHIEWAQLDDYMGLFEHCQSMLERELIDWSMFRDLFGYRLDNIVANPYIVQAKLRGQTRKSWGRFIKICADAGITV